MTRATLEKKIAGGMISLLPFEGVPSPRSVSSVDEALAAIAAHLRQRSSAAHKERIDLEALHAHTGERFAQHVLIPDELHARLRALQGAARRLRPRELVDARRRVRPLA